MRERSRLENFFAQLALAAVMAAIILVAVEYWRSWKSEHDMAAPPRGTAVAYPIAAVQAGSSLSSAGGFVNGASRVPMSEVDRAAEARLEAQLRAAADALGDANERVRILGEERDALMAERDALLAAGSSVEQSVAEQASHAQALERALAQRESELAAITEHMASLEDERDDLARRLGQAETNVGERVSVLERTILARDAELATAEARIAELTRATRLAAAGGSATNAGTAGGQVRPAPEPAAGALPQPRRSANTGAAATTNGTATRVAGRTSNGAGSSPTDPTASTETTEDGVAAYNAGDYARANRIWQSLAENGSPRAQFHLGSLLYEGRLGQPDLVQAYIWLTRSAQRGFGPALAMRERVRASMTRQQLDQARTSLG